MSFSSNYNYTPKLTTKEFIHRAQQVHGNLYDYSKSVYTGIHNELTIICKIHGEFQQSPNSHVYQKARCAKCMNCSPLTTEEFIIRSQRIHGSLYDYSKVQYTKVHDKVIIICKKHGEFKQSSSKHLSQRTGCPQCNQLPGYSNAALDWLNYISNTENIVIRHALNGGEFRIPNSNFKVDGFCELTNTVYEFWGDFWHGNPNVYDSSAINRVNYKTFGELYQNTLHRSELIREVGFNFVEMWESDWNKLKKIILQ